MRSRTRHELHPVGVLVGPECGDEILLPVVEEQRTGTPHVRELPLGTCVRRDLGARASFLPLSPLYPVVEVS